MARCSTCVVCNVSYQTKKRSKHHQSKLHKECIENAVTISLKEIAFNGRLLTYHLKNFNSQQTDLATFLSSLKNILKNLLARGLKKHKCIKCNIWVIAEYFKIESNETQQFSFKTKNIPLFPMSDLDSKIEIEMFDKVVKESEDFLSKGSGWTISQIVGLNLGINKFSALLRPGSFIKFRRTVALVNVKNKDNLCFKYAMLGKHAGDKHLNLPSTYKKLEGEHYDFSCVNFPVPLEEIPIFEKVNNVSVNVFGFNNKTQKYYPIKVDKELPDHTDLLIVNDEDNNSHYCWIKNLAKLLNSQLTGRKGKRFLCKRCLSHFLSEDRLIEHKKSCKMLNSGKPVPKLPEEEDSTLYFKNYSRKIPHDFVVYADFEALLEPLDLDGTSGAYQHHAPMAYAYVIDSSNPHFKTLEPVVFSGADAHVHFVDEMINLGYRVAETFHPNLTPEIRMSKSDKIRHAEALNCDLCEGEFTSEDPKVRDHVHEFSPGTKSNYRAALHQSCNLNYYHPRSLVIFFHNLSKYDMHFIVKALNGRNCSVDIVPSSAETYTSLSIRLTDELRIKFVDSFKFLNSSLSELVASVPESALRRTLNLCRTRTQKKLVTQKGLYPYDYVTERSMLLVSKPPPKSAFFSKLSQTEISDCDYERFLKTWSAFKIKDLADYTNLYLKMDVCQLSDVFEAFRKIALKEYGLDPAHYLTLPAFAFDAFLKQSKVKIKLLTDGDMLDMIMKGIRGGICQNVLPYCKANNKYLEDYDPKKPTTFIQHLDATALYAHTMCKRLPISDYKWVNLETETIDVLEVDSDSEIGYILDVNLSYPRELHDFHSDLPFCCEKKIPSNQDSKHIKLLTTLEPKTNYVIHYEALKQALKHGLVLEKINRAIRFKQTPFMREFMLHNAELRKEAALSGNKFYQDLYKLMNNACYGKLLENPLKWQKIKLATNPRQILRHISAHNFVDRKIFDDQLVASHFEQESIPFKKPIIAGFSVLDLSKVHMYEFYYDKFLDKYGRDNVNLCYTDTDSLILYITTDDLYADMIPNLDLYDTSNFPENHHCYSVKNCKRMGTFKDETKGDPISEYCGLRSKTYAYMSPSVLLMRAKGVQSAVKNCLKFEDYKNSLFNNEIIMRDNRYFQSVGHEIYSSKINKVALSNFDDKRQRLGGIVSLPYGHHSLDNCASSLERPAEDLDINCNESKVSKPSLDNSATFQERSANDLGVESKTTQKRRSTIESNKRKRSTPGLDNSATCKRRQTNDLDINSNESKKSKPATEKTIKSTRLLTDYFSPIKVKSEPPATQPSLSTEMNKVLSSLLDKSAVKTERS